MNYLLCLSLVLEIYYSLSHILRCLQVGVEGLQTLKPQGLKGIHPSVLPANGIKETAQTFGGINLELRLVIAEDSVDDELAKWEVENLKFSVKQPVIKS